MRTAFTTRNTLVAGERIDMALEEGPFQRLSGVWSFHALSDSASRVELVLEFELAGRLLGSALAIGFASIADRMVDDFCREARREGSEERRVGKEWVRTCRCRGALDQ